MKKKGLLHGDLSKVIALLGHTQSLVIADAGLPLPKDIPIIDLAVVPNLPGFIDVLQAVWDEGVFEKAIVAQEINSKNSSVLHSIENILEKTPYDQISHEDFKEKTRTAQCIIRTGETSAYANIILIGGVNF